MANYYGKGRTNIFAVKDVAALKAELEPREFTVEDRGEGKVCILSTDCEGEGDWSRTAYDENGDLDEDAEPFYVPNMIAKHLQDGQVAVFQHIGSEKLRYLEGRAEAVHSNGQQIRINLNDIIDQARTQWNVSSISQVTY